MRDERNPAALRIGLWVGALAVAAMAGAPSPQRDPPLLYLTWNGSYGDPRAHTAITVDCRDTMAVDTMYLTFETRGRPIRLTGISGALVFEPQAGDTLDRFWFLARGEVNEGKIYIDFNLDNSEYADTPWDHRAIGYVGYAHAGGRGRLDMSAHVSPRDAKNLVPRMRYVFARVRLMRSHGALPGCDRPISIAWIGTCVYTPRDDGTWIGPGPDRRITWNAKPAGIRTAGLKLPVSGWLPRFAPPSWRALEAGPAPLKAHADSSSLD